MKTVVCGGSGLQQKELDAGFGLWESQIAKRL
ncbi:MAG: hypothetical protein ACJAZH_000798 [Roseivirga sp.]